MNIMKDVGWEIRDDFCAKKGGMLMKSEREHNYDVLRVVSAMAVIMAHVSALWINGFSAHIAAGGDLEELQHPLAACIYNTLPRFSLPCFMMLSGAFILDNEKAVDYRGFYAKNLKKIGVPTVIFSVLYVLYRIVSSFIGVHGGKAEIISLIMDILNGSPFYHMWYMYMLIGVYLLAPIVLLFKNSISHKNFRRAAYIFLILAGLSQWTGSAWLNWDVGQCFEYLGYFMVGFVIRKDFPKNNFKGLLYIVLGILIELATAFAEYEFAVKRGIAEWDLKLAIVDSYSPSIVAASLLIFAGVTALQIKHNRWTEKLAKMTFIIYLFHAGVNHFIVNVIKLKKGNDYVTMHFDNIYWIPLFTVLVFILSAILAVVYHNIESRFCRRKPEES